MVAMQLHFLSAMLCVLLDPSSRVLMIASSSDKLFEAPDIDVPPVRWTFAAGFLFGELVLVLDAPWGFGFKSETSLPAAEGGSLFGGGVGVLLTGSRRASMSAGACACVWTRLGCCPWGSPLRYAVPWPSNEFVTCRGAGI